MKKSAKFITVCAIITAIGIMLMTAGFFLGARITGFGFNSDGFHVYTLQTAEQATRHTANQSKEDTVVLDAFENIDLKADCANVKIIPSDHFGLSSRLGERDILDYSIEGNTLSITEKSHAQAGSTGPSFCWFYVGPDYTQTECSEPYIEICLPESASLGKVSLESGYGNMYFSGFTVSEFSLFNDYGDVKLKDINADSLQLEMECGSLAAEKVTGDNLNLTNEYGTVDFTEVTVKDQARLLLESGSFIIRDSAFRTLTVESSYGDVTGNTLSCAEGNLTLESGNCSLKNFTTDHLRVDSDYGDVTLSLTAPADAYAYDLFTDYGSIEADGRSMKDRSHYISGEDAAGNKGQITVSCESGDISIRNP